MAPGTRTACDLADHDGPVLVTATSQISTPGVRLGRRGDAMEPGDAMAVGAHAAVAVALDGRNAAAVSWQATAVGVIGVVIGVPLGIGLGHSLWQLFARDISAVPEVTVSVVAMAAVIVGALVLANLAAAVPAYRASRTSTAWLLQAD